MTENRVPWGSSFSAAFQTSVVILSAALIFVSLRTSPPYLFVCRSTFGMKYRITNHINPFLEYMSDRRTFQFVSAWHIKLVHTFTDVTCTCLWTMCFNVAVLFCMKMKYFNISTAMTIFFAAFGLSQWALSHFWRQKVMSSTKKWLCCTAVLVITKRFNYDIQRVHVFVEIYHFLPYRWRPHLTYTWSSSWGYRSGPACSPAWP